MVYCSAVKNNDSMKFAGKWMKLEKKNNHPELDNQDPERHSMYSLISNISCKVKDNQATIHRPTEAR